MGSLGDGEAGFPTAKSISSRALADRSLDCCTLSFRAFWMSAKWTMRVRVVWADSVSPRAEELHPT